jgi:hypothetical protein
MLSAMKNGVTALERAFEIARSGEVAGIEELRSALKQEFYGLGQIEGPALLKQLRAIIRKARESDIASRP